jgi:hypothetical protein
MNRTNSFLLVFLAACCLAGGLAAGIAARSTAAATPTAAELSAAAAAGTAQRWERETAGTIFPATVPYTTDLLTQESATRLGISAATGCGPALDHTLTALAARYGCQAGLRATYADQLQGTVYTAGVLAFRTGLAAADFFRNLPQSPFPATGLRTLPLPGTAAALFTDPARQLTTGQQHGPYVVLVVAGYTDGRAAAATAEQRASVFAAANPLASALSAPLGDPAGVNCHDAAQWSC